MLHNNKIKSTLILLLTAALISSNTVAYGAKSTSIKDNTKTSVTDVATAGFSEDESEQDETRQNTADDKADTLIGSQLTVTFADGDNIISQSKVERGRFAVNIPSKDAKGSDIVAWVADGVKTTDPDAVVIENDITFYVWHPSALKTENHTRYINGADGKFRPDDNITRAELCSMLNNIYELADNQCISEFADVSDDAWYAPYIAKAAAAGIVEGQDDGNFGPAELVTRAELVSALCTDWIEQEKQAAFADTENHKSKNYIAYAAENGWVNGNEEGLFAPDAAVTRAEAVSVINRRLGRSGRESLHKLVMGGIAPFCDVRNTDWYYADIMEAVVEHTSSVTDAGEEWLYFEHPETGHGNNVVYIDGTGYFTDANGQFAFLEPYMLVSHGGKMYLTSPEGTVSDAYNGITSLYGDMYYFNPDHTLLTNDNYGNLHFGDDGKYTCGNDELDKLVDAALAKCTNDSMQQWEKLRASYIYLRDNCKYLSRSHQPRGSTSFVQDSATFMFKHMKGNCYCYASCFLLMAKRLGYSDAYIVSGGVGTKNDDHAWVMIGGKIFDPELEYAYRYRYANKKMYNLYGMSVGTTPFPYHFPE